MMRLEHDHSFIIALVLFTLISILVYLMNFA
jgi:hypothetical protein